jgi:hypothetical protein
VFRVGKGLGIGTGEPAIVFRDGSAFGPCVVGGFGVGVC